MINEIKRSITDQISRLKGQFNKAILDLRLTVEDLQKKKKFYKTSKKMENLEKIQSSLSEQVDKNERFLQKSNLRIEVLKTTECRHLSDIGRLISRATNEPRQMSYIFQQISVAIIRGNAQAITASSRRYAQELVERH